MYSLCNVVIVCALRTYSDSEGTDNSSLDNNEELIYRTYKYDYQ